MITLESARKKAAFVAAFASGAIKVGVVTEHPAFVGPAALKEARAAYFDFNLPRGAHDCFIDDEGISETLCFLKYGGRQKVFVPWAAVATVDSADGEGKSMKRLFPVDEGVSEDTKKKMLAAIRAKTTGQIGIGFAVFHPGVHVVRGVIDHARVEQRAHSKLLFNGGYGDLHINAEGISETLKFLGDGMGPDAMIRVFVPWDAVFCVSEESSRAIRYDAPAPRWDDVKRLAYDAKAKPKFEVVATPADQYTPTPPRTGHLRLIKGEKK